MTCNMLSCKSPFERTFCVVTRPDFSGNSALGVQTACPPGVCKVPTYTQGWHVNAMDGIGTNWHWCLSLSEK